MEKEPVQPMPLATEKEQPIAIVIAEPLKPTQNDSTEGLMRMYAELEPLSRLLQVACKVLFIFSVLLTGSLEGIFGICAACGVLCCAAPGSLGTAYAARCTRVLAILCAGTALCQMAVLSTVGLVLPDMAAALDDICSGEVPEGGDMPLRQHAAKHIVAFAASGARHLQAVAPPTMADVKCERAAEMAQNMLPAAVTVGLALEFSLVVAAVFVAKSARRLIVEARRQGANAL